MGVYCLYDQLTRSEVSSDHSCSAWLTVLLGDEPRVYSACLFAISPQSCVPSCMHHNQINHIKAHTHSAQARPHNGAERLFCLFSSSPPAAPPSFEIPSRQPCRLEQHDRGPGCPSPKLPRISPRHAPVHCGTFYPTPHSCA